MGGSRSQGLPYSWAQGWEVPGPVACSRVYIPGQPHGGSRLGTGDREMRKIKSLASGELGAGEGEGIYTQTAVPLRELGPCHLLHRVAG